MRFPASGKATADAIRNHDWASTPLGPITEWPGMLRTVVNLMLESDFPKAVIWGPELITLHNDAFLSILGNKAPAIGRSFADVWREAWDTIGPIADKAFAGESTFIEDFPLIINRDGSPEQAYFTFCYSPIRDDEGRVVGMMDTVVETTRTVRARQTELVLRQELVHRVKNTLAVASAVVNSTLRHAGSIEEAQASIGSRIDALGKAQELLSVSGSLADVEDLIRRTIAPHIEEWDRVSLLGPNVTLEPQQVMALSLVLYELATNAVKYGAMSSDTGTLAIEWSSEPGGQFAFSWRETCAVPIEPPVRSGFGSRLATRIAPAYFQGEADMTFRPSGLVYTLRGSSRGA